MRDLELLLIRLKFWHARLQQECRLLAEWSSLGVIGCVGIGGCMAFALAALAAILHGHSRPANAFLAGGIGFSLEIAVLTELFLAHECDARANRHRRQIDRLRDEMFTARYGVDGEPDRTLERWNQAFAVIKTCCTGIVYLIVGLLALIGFLSVGAFFVLFVAAAVSAPRDEQQQLMRDLNDAREHQGSTNKPLDFSMETMAVLGGIVLFFVFIGFVLIKSMNQ